MPRHERLSRRERRKTMIKIHYQDGVYRGIISRFFSVGNVCNEYGQLVMEEIEIFLPQGDGTKKYHNGEVYRGEWEKGERHGYGTMQYPNGNVYIGGWKTGKRHGRGDLQTGRGYKIYIGDWKDGQMHGFGEGLNLIDSSIYKGYWKYGQFHGKGEISFQNGVVIDGKFSDGALHGKCKEYNTNCGTAFNVTYEHGICVKHEQYKFAPNQVELGEKLGEGGFGSVYLAKYFVVNELWGILGKWKQCVVKCVNVVGKKLTDVLKEYDLLCRVKSQYAVNVIGKSFVRNSDGFPVTFMIIMEVMKYSLRDHINIRPNMSCKNKVKLIRQCSEGLVYLHRNKIVHRDIKSHNILIGREGSVKYADFGLGKQLVNRSYIMSARAMGTLPWMAPEIIFKGKFSFSSDIYALGCVIYEILFGKLPYKHLENANLIVKAKKLGKLPVMSGASIPRELKCLVRDCLCTDPKKRLSAEEVLRKVEEYQKRKLSSLFRNFG